MGNKVIDISGKKFGMLTVKELHHILKKYSYWTCICDCGREVVVRKNNLWGYKGATTKSCGCNKKRIQRKKFLKPEGHASKMQAYFTFKHNAKSRNIPIEISLEEWEAITQQDCFYCGSKPSNVSISRHDSGSFTYNGIDRLDNTKGYSKDNIVPCCFICNHAKSDLPFDKFISWIKQLARKVAFSSEINGRTGVNT